MVKKTLSLKRPATGEAVVVEIRVLDKLDAKIAAQISNDDYDFRKELVLDSILSVDGKYIPREEMWSLPLWLINGVKAEINNAIGVVETNVPTQN